MFLDGTSYSLVQTLLV